MAKKTEFSEFKTKAINQFTGGKIGTHTISNYPEDCGNGELPDSFLAKDGTYIGDYAKGWWYFRKNLIVCNDYQHGLAILLNKPANKIKDLDIENPDFDKDVKAYYGYTHRGGNTFKLGDRLFDEQYEPKEKDYPKEEWDEFKSEREKSILKNIKEGWCENREKAEKEIPISDVIPFVKRGSKLIETWDEAKQAAINLSKYLS